MEVNHDAPHFLDVMNSARPLISLLLGASSIALLAFNSWSGFSLALSVAAFYCGYYYGSKALLLWITAIIAAEFWYQTHMPKGAQAGVGILIIPIIAFPALILMAVANQLGRKQRQNIRARRSENADSDDA